MSLCTEQAQVTASVEAAGYIVSICQCWINNALDQPPRLTSALTDTCFVLRQNNKACPGVKLKLCCFALHRTLDDLILTAAPSVHRCFPIRGYVTAWKRIQGMCSHRIEIVFNCDYSKGCKKNK